MLRDAGLTTSQQIGSTVLHTLTTLGVALLRQQRGVVRESGDAPLTLLASEGRWSTAGRAGTCPRVHCYRRAAAHPPRSAARHTLDRLLRLALWYLDRPRGAGGQAQVAPFCQALSDGNSVVEFGLARDAARVIERDVAVQAVEDQLELDYQQWRAVSAKAVRMAVVSVEEHELVWIVSWQSEDFVRTRKCENMLIGNGPYLVDRVDGRLHQIGVVSAHTGEWETDYRARIRGLTVRTEVDDLHDALRAVAAARGRMHAVRTLRRRLPMFSPSEAIEYVSALLEGDAPASLVAVATEELVEPFNPVLGVKTVTSGMAIRAAQRPEE
ncbi:YrhB domain-containing protein [Streptomyces pseudovenezuelae]|uniref:YrhB domain-containing protein n=1 Tax=Streptomyces pseudovenezuelae TaxID=67350 RepID=UPI003719C2A0